MFEVAIKQFEAHRFVIVYTESFYEVAESTMTCTILEIVKYLLPGADIRKRHR